MKRIFPVFLVSLMIIYAFTFSNDDGTKNLSQKNTSFSNGTVVVNGPALDYPLSTLSESFEGATFPPAGWTKLSPDGGTGWTTITAGTTPLPGWNGGVATVPPGGGTKTAYATWNTGGATANDQWLITPQIMNVQPNDSLKFWLRKPGYAGAYLDNFDVKISTTTPVVASFTINVLSLVSPASSPDTNWVQYKFRLGDFVTAGANIYIGFREWVLDNFNDGSAFQLDLISVTEGSAPAGYFNNFESYTVGQRLACQDSLNWTTWSIAPCDAVEDPLISNAQSFSPTKSVVITQNNDLVKRLNNDSTGVHEISMKFYVPTGKAGYWNTLAVFAGSSSKWGMECYFDATATGNNGRLLGGSSTAVPFPYTHGAWQTTKLLVNLDVDSAKFFINGTLVHKWKWSAGASGVAVPKKLGGNDFFGATATDEMYIDDYSYMPGANWITGVTQNGNTVPVEYALSQNYPNPFNPVTKINFALPKSGLVTMKVYNVLGKEVATLVNEVKNAGSYTVDFDGANLSSGIYLYKISINGFSEVKKMMLIK